ncbi:hypothetical protein HanIR_Chr13g0618831 [Helianthus annuus]|nr:hypothetical protein HanIR_Chr13g0618831 [Helianthus annuus]
MEVLRVIGWPLLSINKSLASLGCLKSVEQCFIFLCDPPVDLLLSVCNTWILLYTGL